MKYFLFLVATLAGCAKLSAQTLKDAIRLTENEQFDMATVQFQNLVMGMPSNGTYFYFFGENYLLADNPDSAKVIFNLGLKAEPANVLNEIGLAKIELDNGNGGAETGTKMIEAALAKAGPKNAQAMIEAADAFVHYKTKNLDKATQILDKAYPLDPKNPEIQILYGDISSERNNGSAAAEYYNRALELDKTSVRAIVAKGKLYKRSTNFEGAAEDFMRAIQIDGNFAPAHRELGESYIKLGKLEKAKEEYRKYLELSRNNCAARIRYASFLYLSKDYAGAITEISSLKQNCDSNNVTLLRVSSYCYYETKECVKGIEAVEKLFKILPESKRIINDYEYYGKLMVCANRDSLGVIALRKAYEMDKTRLDLLVEIGNSFIKVKKYDDAAVAFREKVNAGRDVKSLDYFKLGQSYFFGGKFQEADTVFNKLTDIQPKWPSGFLWNAKNKTRIDSSSEAGLAKPMYEKYIELALADSANIKKYVEGLKEAYSYLASYYYREMHDKANALANLRKKLEITDDATEKKDISGIIEQIEKEGKR